MRVVVAEKALPRLLEKGEIFGRARARRVARNWRPRTRKQKRRPPKSSATRRDQNVRRVVWFLPQGARARVRAKSLEWPTRADAH